MAKNQGDETTDNYSLTPKQARAIGYLLSCRTIADAAKKSGVTEKTIFTWMQDKAFRLALQDAERETIDAASRRLMQGQAEALDALASLITKSKNESVKRAAAIDWLNLTLKYRDLNDLDRRITELEKAVLHGN